jgi:hypothetical protein
MLMGYYKSGIALALLVTVTNVIFILRTMLAATVLLGQSSVVTRVLKRVGLVNRTRSGSKVFSSNEIFVMDSTSLSLLALRHYDGHMGNEVEDALRGETKGVILWEKGQTT